MTDIERSELEDIRITIGNLMQLGNVDLHSDFTYLLNYVEEQAEQLQELEVYVDESTKKAAELNAFLQKQGATKHLGKHVVDAVMEHVRELEARDRGRELAHKLVVGHANELDKQNKRYRGAINNYFEIDGDYKEIADKAERIFRRVLEGAQ